MTWYPEPDIYLVSRTVGGLPTCTFSPKPYPRRITNIVVGNTATSEVKCYRGTLGSTPVAQNLLGANNTLKGPISLPAGQLFFVQWSTAGSAFARVSFERSDNPLEEVDISFSSEWATDAITSITIPNTAGPFDAKLVIGSVVPPELEAFYNGGFYNSHVVHAILHYFGGNPNPYFYEVTLELDFPPTYPHARGWGIAGTIYEQEFMSQFLGPNIQNWTSGFANPPVSRFIGDPSASIGAALASDLSLGHDTDFIIGIKSHGRGLVDSVSSNANTGAIGAETITLTSNNVTFQNGRAFYVRNAQHLHGSIVNFAQVRVKQTNLAGITLMVKRTQALTAALGTAGCFDYGNIFVNTRGSNFTGVLVASLAAQGGGTVTGVAVAAGEDRRLDVWDIGAASDYAGAPSLV